MQWMILITGVVMLWLLTRKSLPATPADSPMPAREHGMSAFLADVAAAEKQTGYAQPLFSKKVFSRMRKNILLLLRFSEHQLLPQARQLCENGRFLQFENADLLSKCKSIPPLPSNLRKQPLVSVLIHAYLAYGDCLFAKDSFLSALTIWQERHPLSEEELDALPFLFRMELLRVLSDLSFQCVQDQQARNAAYQACTLFKHGKIKAALRIVRKHAKLKGFGEALLAFDDTGSCYHSLMEKSSVSPEEMVQTEHKRRAAISLSVQNAVSSLQAIKLFPWSRALEEASLAHKLLNKDSVYLQMDDESRKIYRSRVSKIAKRFHLSERAVTSAVFSLCSASAPGSVANHCGFYLFDDGYPKLLKQLNRLSPLRKILFFLKRHLPVLWRAASWTAFFGLLALGFVSGYAIAALIPFALLMLIVLKQTALSIIQSRLQSKITPRIKINHLEDDQRILVVCPEVLGSAEQGLEAVKKLLVMHEGNPDRNIHFLLLGDFQESLTAVSSADAEIVSTVSKAVESLSEIQSHPFLYMQRQRTYAHGDTFRHSAIDAILRLIAGQPFQERLAYSSFDPSFLSKNYQYVITLDRTVFLPPGSVLGLAGAMLHPLQKRCTFNGSLRGVSVLQPRLEAAVRQNKTLFSRFMDGFSSDSSVLSSFFGCSVFSGTGIIDPEAWLQSTQKSARHEDELFPPMLAGALSGCALCNHVRLFHDTPVNLVDYLRKRMQKVKSAWQSLPHLLPLIGIRSFLSPNSRLCLWHELLACAAAPLQLFVLVYAAAANRSLLFLAALLLPAMVCFHSNATDAFVKQLIKLAVLPCEACLTLDTLVRTVCNLFVSRRHTPDRNTTLPSFTALRKPPAIIFTLNFFFAGLFAASVLLFNGAWPAMAVSVLWAVFPVLQPYLEQEYRTASLPNEYIRDSLLRLARETYAFFDASITNENHALPPQSMQTSPDKGANPCTTPASIALYLCSLISAEKLNILPAAEVLQLLSKTIHTVESLPKWHGLSYAQYDTRTLLPTGERSISSSDCGLLAAGLLTCAQGVRAFSETEPEVGDLPLRMEKLCTDMQLHRLYDPDAGLFFIERHPGGRNASSAHHTLFASESRLLSFVAIALEQIPEEHWRRLERYTAFNGTLVSASGGMRDYMTPFLFQPLTRNTLLYNTCQQVFQAQKRHRFGGAFGVSSCGCYEFDPALNYQTRNFGIPQLALHGHVPQGAIAPYASMLCLEHHMKEVFENLQRLKALGLESPLGLFEAADFSETASNQPSIVRSYSAQHQGMILCAVCNTLCSSYLTHLFSDIPLMQAYRHLLEESPVKWQHSVRRPIRSLSSTVQSTSAFLSREVQPLCFPVEAHLLGGGDTSVLIDTQGSGYIKHGNIMLTRFDEECCNPTGPRIYIRDSESGAYWIATDPRLTRSIRFTTSQAVFKAERFDICSELRIWVDPLDGSCIHHLTVENTSPAERTLEICSYLEISSYIGNPETHSIPFCAAPLDPYGVALETASADDQTPRPIWHLLCTDMPIEQFRIQTDRWLFLGRGRTFIAPSAMNQPINAVDDYLGETLDPCISLRAQFILPPNSVSFVSFVTHMPDSPSSKITFLERYRYGTDILRRYDCALTRGISTARYLRLTTEMQEDISRITGALAYRGQPRRCIEPSAFTLQHFGIDGTCPILLYTCLGSANEPLLRLMLDAQSLFRFNGFKIALVIVIEESSNQSEIRASVEAAIQSDRRRTAQQTEEQIYVFSHLSQPEIQALKNTARAVFSASGGSVSGQLDASRVSLRARPKYVCRSSAKWKPSFSNETDLLLDNGLGGFVKETGDYQITLLPGNHTPASWRNLLSNPVFTSSVSESGFLAPNTEAVYLRDEEQKLIWSITRLPLGHGTAIRVTHAPGETIFESVGYGIRTRMQCFTDRSRAAGLRIIHLHNDSTEKRTLTLFHSYIFDQPDAEPCRVECAEDHAGCYLPLQQRYAGLCAVEPAKAEISSMPSGLFQGLWSPVPYALSCMEKLPQDGGNTAILSYDLLLEPGESCSLVTALAYEKTREDFVALIETLRQEGATECLRSLRRMWEDELGVLQFDLPDPALNLLLGRWLPYQAAVACLHARHSVQAELPALLSRLLTHPERVRTRILHHAETLPKDMKRSQDESGVSPDLLPLLYLIAAYLQSTGDTAILQASLDDARDSETLHIVCLRAMDGIPCGAHNLPLVNEVENTGTKLLTGNCHESVLAGMFLCETLRIFAAFFERDAQPVLNQRRAELMEALERYAWDGRWYATGWNTAGKRIGGAGGEEGTLYLIAQCMAVICGLSRERCEVAMENVWQLLYQPSAGIMKSALSCSTKGDPSYQANEKQHTAAACVAIAALHQLGQIERAWELLGALIPCNHAATKQMAEQYKAEPYVIAQTLFSTQELCGRGVDTWHSSSAAMLQIVVIDQLLGLRKNGSRLTLKPSVPEGWDTIRITYRFGSATYHLHASRSCTQPVAEGKRLDDGVLELTDDGRIHEATFPIR